MADSSVTLHLGNRLAEIRQGVKKSRKIFHRPEEMTEQLKIQAHFNTLWSLVKFGFGDVFPRRLSRQRYNVGRKCGPSIDLASLMERKITGGFC